MPSWPRRFSISASSRWGRLRPTWPRPAWLSARNEGHPGGPGPAAVQTRQRDGNCRKLLSGSSTEDAMPESTSSSSQPESQPEPNEKLVKIFDSEQENEAIVVQGLLESAGIESDLKSIDAVQNAFPGVGGTVILVREEDALEAKKIIEAYRKLPPLDDETADLPG